MHPIFSTLNVIERIVDHLYDDIHTLKATSLVSKTWLYSGHCHRLQTIFVCGRDRFQIFVSVTGPQISPYVVTLTLRDFFVPSWRASNVGLLALFQLLRTLPRLQHFILDFAELDDHGLPDTLPDFEPPRHIETLTLRRCIFKGLQAPTFLLLAFSSVKTMTLSGIVMQGEYPMEDEDDDDDDEYGYPLQEPMKGWFFSQQLSVHKRNVKRWSLPSLLRVEELVLDKPCGWRFMSLLATVLSAGSLQTLKLASTPNRAIDEILPISTEFGMNIRSLSMNITFHPDEHLSAQLPTLDFSNLKSLYITLFSQSNGRSLISDKAYRAILVNAVTFFVCEVPNHFPSTALELVWCTVGIDDSYVANTDITCKALLGTKLYQEEDDCIVRSVMIYDASRINGFAEMLLMTKMEHAWQSKGYSVEPIGLDRAFELKELVESKISKALESLAKAM